MKIKHLLLSFIQIILLLLTLSSLAQALEIHEKSAPKRIIVLEFSLLDDLLQLGIKPIGIASSRADEGSNPPFLLPYIKDIANVGTRQQPSLEKIMALHPDLIIADITMQKKIYPLLKRIAPTILLNGLLGNIDAQEKNLRIIAKITQTENKVDTLIKQLRMKYAAAKKIGQAHPANIMIGYANNAGQFQVLTANALTSLILKDLGHPNLITILSEEQSAPI